MYNQKYSPLFFHYFSRRLINIERQRVHSIFLKSWNCDKKILDREYHVHHWQDGSYTKKIPKLTLSIPLLALSILGLSIFVKNEILCEGSIGEKKEDKKKESKEQSEPKDDIVSGLKSDTSDDSRIAEDKLSVLRKPDVSKSHEGPPSALIKDFSEYFRDASLSISMKTAIDSSRALLNRKLIEAGAPGIAVAVSIDGQVVWAEGIGYQDVENSVKMVPHSVLRIASISKSLTMTAVAQLVEKGKLDLDAPVQKYVPSFPPKFVDGKEVTLTTRQLLSHTSGIRHYSLKGEEEPKHSESGAEKQKEQKQPKERNKKASTEKELKERVKEKRQRIRDILSDKLFPDRCVEDKNDGDEFDLEEYYIKEHFTSITEALKLFQDDDLLFTPGEGYKYTSHGWTLVSAVVEGASNKSFVQVMKELFKTIGMSNTYFEVNDDIIHRRARHYIRTKKAVLKNAPYIDNSYKWAGGGFVSTVLDLVRFGNCMLYSFQLSDDDKEALHLKPGLLKQSTMRETWKSVPNTKMVDKEGSYALGWGVVEGEDNPRAFCNPRRFYVAHTGGAVGASSVLHISPKDPILGDHDNTLVLPTPPKGIVVAIITNMQSVGLNSTAVSIANLFARVRDDSKVMGSIKGASESKVYSLSGF